MSSPQSGMPDNSFQNRLNKVAEARAPIEAAKPQVEVIPDWKENFKYPATIVAAALVGMLAVFVARYARFHLMGGSLAGEDADITMMIDGAIGIACSFVLFSALRFRGAEFKAAQTFGILAMIMIMHNFVHAAPKAFNLVFSEEWTNQVIAMTEPGSILFRGASFVVIEPKEEKPTIPTVRRAGKA
ncbi:MAG: hypothetical protein HKN18_07580 [Silicimonas sp.]|nr:hypothetical protein [Silicimonas sp.]